MTPDRLTCLSAGSAWPGLGLLLLLLTASCNLQPASATDLLFVGTNEFLGSNPPKSMSSYSLTASLASLLSVPAPGVVGKASSDEINRVISPNFLSRPAAVWAVVVNGFSAEDSEAFGRIQEWKEGAGRVQTGPVELAGDSAGRVLSDMLAVLQAEGGGVKAGKVQGQSLGACEDSCLEKGLIEVAGAVGMSYEAGEVPLAGWTVVENGQVKVDLRLKSKAMRAWVRELVELWEQVKRMGKNDESQSNFWYTTLAGLQLVRTVHAVDTKEFGVAVDLTWGLMGKVHELLEEVAGGEVVTQISFVGDVDSLPVGHEFAVEFNSQATKLLQLSAEKSNAIDTEARKNSFNTKATAFGITIFIFFFLLGGLYTMVNMDFTSDTFLYSQSKVD